jgi:protocatechuate 3,4-dioxygenase alpha subunit
MSAAPTVTASQTVGPFFHIGLRAVEAAVRPGASAVTVRGRVTDGAGVAVPDALLEVWAPATPRDADDDTGFCRVFTNDDGSFSLTVVRPDAAAAGADGQAPHLAVLLFMRGLLRHLITRVYFPDEPSNAADPVLSLVPPQRRDTLVARRASDGSGILEWDVVLQGSHETVFFEC